jgi:hypothetical protein
VTPRRKSPEWRIVINSYPCAICGAPPGRHCVTDTGRNKGEPHADRARHAALRGWAMAEDTARCYRCHGPLPEDARAPARCARCILREDGARPLRATADHPGPDGSYDVPLFGGEE